MADHCFDRMGFSLFSSLRQIFGLTLLVAHVCFFMRARFDVDCVHPNNAEVRCELIVFVSS
jgi:hypothetical protein